MTSLAVAFYATPWLVPPYLVLMALILGAPTSSRTSRSGQADWRRRDRTRRPQGLAKGPRIDPPPFQTQPGQGAAGASDESDVVCGPDAEAESEPGQFPSLESPAAKARRIRGKSRKLRPDAAIEPPSSTWVRVGPGKFVRADLALPASLSGELGSPPPDVPRALVDPNAAGAPAATDPGDALTLFEPLHEDASGADSGTVDTEDRDRVVIGGESLGGEVGRGCDGLSETGAATGVVAEASNGDHGNAPEAPGDTFVQPAPPTPQAEAEPAGPDLSSNLETAAHDDLKSMDANVSSLESNPTEPCVTSRPIEVGRATRRVLPAVRAGRYVFRALAALGPRRSFNDRRRAVARSGFGRCRTPRRPSDPRFIRARAGRSVGAFHLVDRSHRARSPPRVAR
jgi:hypothetical protein